MKLVSYILVLAYGDVDRCGQYLSVEAFVLGFALSSLRHGQIQQALTLFSGS